MILNLSPVEILSLLVLIYTNLAYIAPHGHKHPQAQTHTCLLFLLLGHQFMVTRDDKLSSAILLFLKVHIHIVCFWDSEADRDNDNDNRDTEQAEEIKIKKKKAVFFKDIQSKEDERRRNGKIQYIERLEER